MNDSPPGIPQKLSSWLEEQLERAVDGGIQVTRHPITVQAFHSNHAWLEEWAARKLHAAYPIKNFKEVIGRFVGCFPIRQVGTPNGWYLYVDCYGAAPEKTNDVFYKVCLTQQGAQTEEYLRVFAENSRGKPVMDRTDPENPRRVGTIVEATIENKTVVATIMLDLPVYEKCLSSLSMGFKK